MLKALSLVLLLTTPAVRSARQAAAALVLLAGARRGREVRRGLCGRHGPRGGDI